MKMLVYCVMGATLLMLGSCATQPPATIAVIEPVAIAPPLPEPVPEPEPAIDTGFPVSQERYTTSLQEIRDLVENLNAIISDLKFEDWKAHLDSAYIKKFSDPAYLTEIVNGSPRLKEMLKQANQRFRTLGDYFNFIVNPSRSRVVVDDISFVDEERVEAYTLINNEKLRLYQLKLYGKEWKISFW